MFSFPTYLQYDAMDCGPTCLRIIMAYYGKKVSFQELKEKTHIDHEGVSMLGISKAAQEMGFQTMGVSISYDQLKEDVNLPCIAHWNQNHFIVIYKIKKKKSEEIIYVVDPAIGKMKLSKKKFCDSWINLTDNDEEKGIVLILKPTSVFYEIKPTEKKPHNYTFIFSYIKPYQKLITQLIIGLIIGSFLQLIFPFLTQAIVDIGINNQDLKFIYLILIAQLILTLSSASVNFIRGWILLYMGTRINITLISDFLIKLMCLPIGFFDTKMTGDILQRITDHNRIQGFLTNSSLSVLFSMFNIVIFSIILCLYSAAIFGIFILGSILYLFWVWSFMERRAELDYMNFSLQASNQSSLIELITGMQEIKLNTCEQQKQWEWERIQAKLFKLQIKDLALGQYQDSGAVLINQIKNIVISAFVAKLVIDGHMTLGMMISVQYIIGQLNSPVDQMINFIRQFQDAKLSFERLNEIYKREDEEKEGDKYIQKIPENENIYIKNVSFSYSKVTTAEPTINNINLTIPVKKQTAIVGMSGSGKTTLIKLLLGFYPLDNGAIFLGNKTLDDYSKREWRKQCGVVMQDGYIFSNTIAHNIAPGYEDINEVILTF